MKQRTLIGMLWAVRFNPRRVYSILKGYFRHRPIKTWRRSP